jgi:hypothetical protein
LSTEQGHTALIDRAFSVHRRFAQSSAKTGANAANLLRQRLSVSSNVELAMKKTFFFVGEVSRKMRGSGPFGINAPFSSDVGKPGV